MPSCSDLPASFGNISLVCHADWSIHAQKRWAVAAYFAPDHHWQCRVPVRVADPVAFLLHLQSLAGLFGCILAGFDFPIGLPVQYAHKVGIKSFIAALPLFGSYEWDQFFSPAETPAEISLYRPFYPLRPGHARRSHLESALGLHFLQLYRLCEMANINRPPACPLFWTLGSQQVGKAAIHGWRALLMPALAHPRLRLKLWPFSGTLAELCQPGNLVVVETYPAEFYAQLGLFQPGHRLSKRRRDHRQSCAARLTSWSSMLQLDLHDSLTAMINDGFSHHASGEDQFDALVGLYGMINVLVGNHPTGEPFSPPLSTIEGWIFGQEQS